MIPTTASPAIRTRKKARRSELDEARAIEYACWLVRSTPFAVPVISHGKFLGTVQGDPEHSSPWFVPAMYAAPIADTYDGHVAVNASRHQHRFTWHKRFGAGAAGDWYSLFAATGDPQPGVYTGTARTAKSCTRSTAGAMRLGPAVSPAERYLRRQGAFANAANATGYMIVDRVIAYDQCSMSASSQNMTNSITATRWISAGQRAMQIFGVADAAHNATAANLTAMGYTNENGNGSRAIVTTPTLAKIVSISAPSAGQGARSLFQEPGNTTRTPGNPFLVLQSGDLGVRQIDNYQWSAAPTGTCCWELDVPLAVSPDLVTSLGASTDYEHIYGVDSLQRLQIYDDACLTVLGFRVTSTDTLLTGYISVGWSA